MVRKQKNILWRTVNAPKGYELDVTQVYMSEFTKQAGVKKIRLFFRRVAENERK